MTKMFGNLKSDGLAEAEDRVGGGYEPYESGVYDLDVKMIYAGKAANSNAQNVTLLGDIDGKEYRETFYVTNRNGENFYTDKNDSSKKNPLPGFTLLNDLSLFLTGEEISEQDTEEKVVKVYDFDEKKEINKPVPVFTEMTGKVKVAILRVIEDKRKRGDDGEYRPTGETRTFNQLEKAMHAETGMTVLEVKAEMDEPEFLPAWEAKNAGKDRNRASGGNGGGTGEAGSGKPGGFGAKSQKKKLFGG